MNVTRCYFANFATTRDSIFTTVILTAFQKIHNLLVMSSQDINAQYFNLYNKLVNAVVTIDME